MKAVQMNDIGMTQGIGISSVRAGEEKGNNKKDGQVKNGTVFAGGLGGMTTDRIEQRRQQAKTQAGKLIMDQFAADNELTDTIQEHRDRIKNLSAERSNLMDLSKEYADGKETLKEKYGITPDSQEQKDLELIEKARNLMKPSNGSVGLSSLSGEELKRLGEMGPLTEYQERALAFDKAGEFIDSQIKDINDEIEARGKAISGIKQGMLKMHGMADAGKAAGDVMDAASRDIIGMVMADARKHIDEEMEKLREAAKKAAEKKEAEEEKKEKTQEKEEEQEKLTESIQEGVSGKDAIQQEVDKILEEAKLLEEEMKGLVVDGQF